MKVIFFFILFFGSFVNLFAHDLGVATAEFRELSSNNYRLRVQSSITTQSLFSAPVLPSRCHLTTPPKGRLSQNSIDYEFTCLEPLVSDDTIYLPWEREGVVINSFWLDKSSSSQFFPAESRGISVVMAHLNAGSGSIVMIAKRYLTLGIEHILTGYDHLLFVLSLLLLITRTWLLIETITAFTVAHSITLGLASLGFLDIPTLAVEASIALSVAFLAAEVVRHYLYNKLSLTAKAPWLVAFIFGLLHGLGFASALSGLGLPQKEILPALLFFNLGVEFGQLSFIAFIMTLGLLFIWIFKRDTVVLRPVIASVIGIVAMYWFVERSFMILV